MTNIATTSVEDQVLDALPNAPLAVDVDTLVSVVQKAHQDVRAVDVKIAALSLVSQGRMGLNDAWQFSRVE